MVAATTGKDYGPEWQIEQQIKHYEGLAVAYRADAARYLVNAEEAESMALRYRRALEKLKD